MAVFTRIAAGATVGLSLVAGSPVAAQRTALSGNAPKLIVFIAVDQMRADYFERFLPQLKGGLGRLYRGGAVFTNAYQDHAITETAPGHSVMLSGRFPGHTGIVTNSLGVPDAQAPLIGGGGDGASPFRFRGSVLIDWLRMNDPRSRALSVSRKDRGAILPIGRAHQSAFWYATDGRFTTSTYYADTLPSWVQQFNARKIPQSYAGKMWTLLLPESSYPEPDSVPFENFQRNFVFPHPFSGDPEQVAAAFAAYPMMDSLTAQMALDGVAAMKLGTGPQTDLLSVSFSTTDAIGHAFGPDSRELHDQILRLDRYMGAFIDSLYRMRDSTTIAFALTADMGCSRIRTSAREREHVPALRADVSTPFATARAALRAAGATGDPLALRGRHRARQRGSLAGTALKPDSVLDALAESLRKVTGVAQVDFVRDLARADTTNDFARASVAAHAAVGLRSGPGDLARAVRVLRGQCSRDARNAERPRRPCAGDFLRPWFIAGKYSQRALVADMAPTLAAIADVTPSEKLDGRVRTEAIRKR